MGSSGPGRVRVERGIYRQPNGKYAVCWRHAGRLRFRTVGFDLAEARRERLALIAATREGSVPVSPRLRFETVAGRWLERFEVKVAAGERHPRTLEAHRYQLDRHLLPGRARRRIASITVDYVAELPMLRRKGCSAKTSASALAMLQSVMRFARRARIPQAASRDGCPRPSQERTASVSTRLLLQESRTLARSSRRRPAGCLFARCALRAAPGNGRGRAERAARELERIRVDLSRDACG
jgi:hypothetical protein